MKARVILARIKTISGGLTARLFVALGAMALTTAAAVAIGNLVFQNIATGLDDFVEIRVPHARDSAELVRATNGFNDALAGILTANDEAKLAEYADVVQQAVDQSASLASTLPDGYAERLEPLIQSVNGNLGALLQARREEFANLDRIDAIVADTLMAGADASVALIEASDTAYFDLALGGEDTIETVDQAFEQLVNEEFATLQLVLQTRAEVNLLTGVTLALAESRGSDVAPILRDVSSAARDKLDGMRQELAANDSLAPISEIIGQVLEATSARTPTTESVLSLRQEADAATASALDDIMFDLMLRTEEVSADNETTIRNLLDGEVSRIRDLAALDSASKQLFATALQAALAPDADRANALQADLTAAARDVRERAAEHGVDQQIAPLLTVADPQMGVVPSQLAVISAREKAATAATAAAASVHDVAAGADAFGSSTVQEIGSMAGALAAEVEGAQQMMLVIAVVSVGLILTIPVLAIVTIIRPLRRVAATTERLSQGDLAEVVGLDRAAGEIGQMASALKVFRESMIDQIRLQKEEAEREAADRERAAREEQEAREREEAERARKEHAEREQRERDAEEQRAREELRAAAEAERQERAAEQERVVSELAEGMKHLAAGRVDFRIATAFPEAYESLRIDFNEAVGELSDVIRMISDSAGKIDLSSGEIASAATDLSRRTENSAATLEQTAASLNELTASVTSTAQGASQADRTVQGTKSNAEESSEVVRQAVSAMSEIEASSKQISKIIDVIDDIAFQTNLLALNAGVEAARAGDAGRGFAVVASEVRALAQRSSEAAREINGLISDSNSHVERGVTLVDKAGDALQSIIASFGEVSRHVSEIAASASEQATGITEINSAASQLDEATQQNAAMFEESTAASRILMDEARKLAEMVSRFTISDDVEAGGMRDEEDDRQIA